MLAIIAIAVYSYFAVRWGFRFVDGRWEALERAEMKPIKIIVSIFLGYITAGLYFVLWCVKKIFTLWD